MICAVIFMCTVCGKSAFKIWWFLFNSFIISHWLPKKKSFITPSLASRLSTSECWASFLSIRFLKLFLKSLLYFHCCEWGHLDIIFHPVVNGIVSHQIFFTIQSIYLAPKMWGCLDLEDINKVLVQRQIVSIKKKNKKKNLLKS